MNFIRKIFEGKTDADVHTQFVRFGPGTYEGRGAVKIKAQAKGKFKIWTGFEYGNSFIKFIAENTKDEMIDLKGKIFAKKEFDMSTEKKKGFYLATVDQHVPVSELKRMLKEMPDAYFLLDVKTDDVVLKMKKAPHNPRGKYDEKFCVMIITEKLKAVVDDLTWDIKGSFKSVEISHMFIIEDVKIDEKLVEKDPAQARLEAIKVGKMIRNTDVDGKTNIVEIDFEA